LRQVALLVITIPFEKLDLVSSLSYVLESTTNQFLESTRVWSIQELVCSTF